MFGRRFEVKKDQNLGPQQTDGQVRTLHVLSGAVWFQLNGIEFDLIPGACLTIRSGDTHLLYAIEDSIVLEVSSPPVADAESVDANEPMAERQPVR